MSGQFLGMLNVWEQIEKNGVFMKVSCSYLEIKLVKTVFELSDV